MVVAVFAAPDLHHMSQGRSEDTLMGTNWRDTGESGQTPRNQARTDRKFLELMRRRQAVVWGTIALLVLMIMVVVAF